MSGSSLRIRFGIQVIVAFLTPLVACDSSKQNPIDINHDTLNIRLPYFQSQVTCEFLASDDRFKYSNIDRVISKCSCVEALVIENPDIPTTMKIFRAKLDINRSQHSGSISIAVMFSDSSKLEILKPYRLTYNFEVSPPESTLILSRRTQNVYVHPITFFNNDSASSRTVFIVTSKAVRVLSEKAYRVQANSSLTSQFEVDSHLVCYQSGDSRLRTTVTVKELPSFSHTYTVYTLQK